jgi:hypothetical protein
LRVHPARSAVTISLLSLSIILSNVIFFNLVGYRYRYDFSGCLFWANLLLLVASYIEILPPALRRIGAQPADESSGSQFFLKAPRQISARTDNGKETPLIARLAHIWG